MSVPNWWAALLLSLAAYRVFRLLAEDDILDWPRRRLLRLADDWTEDQALPDGYRVNLALFITCVACLGWWVSLAWYAAWQLWPHGALVVAAPFAISAVLIFLRRNLDPPAE